MFKLLISNCWYFLDNFSRHQRITIVGTFAMAMCKVRFPVPAHNTLVEGMTRSAVSFLTSTFREKDWSNPTKDKDGELGDFYYGSIEP